MRRRTSLILSATALSAGLVAAGIVGLARGGGEAGEARAEVVPIPELPELTGLGVAPGAPLDEQIAALQTRLASVPGDYPAWATLGLAYVQQARITGDPAYYPRAQGALDTSLEVGREDNFLAYAGLSALASARHDFAAAKGLAEQGLAVNGYSALLWGVLSDAELQLGNYDAARAAVDRMVGLSPDATSLARASYLAELRGDVDGATTLMQRARDDAYDPDTRAFAAYHLGELAYDRGDPNEALRQYLAALEASPDDVAALAGRARAEAALGQTQTALDHYAEVVRRAPEPTYLVAYGDLLASLGRADEAQRQYDVFATTQALFEANGVQLDAGPILFYADHGEPERALAAAEAGISTRPFLAMWDAYAWALHRNGRSAEALDASARANELGTRSALFRYHAGMIRHAVGDLDGARVDLAAALEINPHFDPLAAVTARATLASLEPAA